MSQRKILQRVSDLLNGMVKKQNMAWTTVNLFIKIHTLGQRGMPRWIYMVWENSWQEIERNMSKKSKKPQTMQTWRYANHIVKLYFSLRKRCIGMFKCKAKNTCSMQRNEIDEHLHCAASDQINRLILLSYLQVIQYMQRNPLQDAT